jgi:hypothetical protein
MEVGRFQALLVQWLDEKLAQGGLGREENRLVAPVLSSRRPAHCCGRARFAARRRELGVLVVSFIH